jgi:hypothetical protein
MYVLILIILIRIKKCNMYMYIYIYIYILISIHPYIHPSMHPSIHSSMHPCIHPCIHANVCDESLHARSISKVASVSILEPAQTTSRKLQSLTAERQRKCGYECYCCYSNNYYYCCTALMRVRAKNIALMRQH